MAAHGWGQGHGPRRVSSFWSWKRRATFRLLRPQKGAAWPAPLPGDTHFQPVTSRTVSAAVRASVVMYLSVHRNLAEQ